MPALPSRSTLAGMAVALLCLLAWPGVRQALEASMTRHMLVQYPLLMLAGFLFAAAWPPGWTARLNRWNAHGISGLLAAGVMLGILMIPRVLDLALVDGRAEILKFLALLICGAATRLSWQPAGVLVQGFFLGNVLPMMVVAGNLYETSPVRICNAYLLDDQARLGQLLVWIAAVVAAAWFGWLVGALMRRDAVMLQADTAPKAGAR
ncbi:MULTISPECIES: hypothetical protein [unclassified Polaromonas]|uniref:hypothetical protein n=1 Tax=unclassified Polaromonas TaxID=2638319 RepID=UPI0018940B9E|nr:MULTISPECIES: hypothetical protein [unclassified Polaromonas]